MVFLVRGIQKTDIERGMVLSAPGAITPHTKFEGEVYVLTKKKVADILLSLQDTDRNSTLELQMLLELLHNLQPMMDQLQKW